MSFVNVILLAIIHSPINKMILDLSECKQSDNANNFAKEFSQLQKNGGGHKDASKLRKIVDPTDDSTKMGKPENFYEKVMNILPESVRKSMQFKYVWTGKCDGCKITVS